MRRFRLPVAATLAVGAIGCGPGRHEAPAPRAPPSPVAAPEWSIPARPAPSRRAQLVYELGGRPFPLPLLRGSIAGHDTWMIVDTGATSHAVTAWFAQKHGLPLAAVAGRATDHAGRPVPMLRTEAALARVEGWGSLGSGPFLVYEMPEIIERIGVGMFVSPQNLTEEGRAVVLDLERREMRIEATVDALAAPKQGSLLATARGCVEAGSIRGLSFVVPGTIEGRAARLLVDTGAQHTDLFDSSEPGAHLSKLSVPSQDKAVGASGRIGARTIRRARVVVGEHAAALDVDLIAGRANESCPRDGVVGMDLLRGCVLVFADGQLAARCGRGGDSQGL